MYFIKVVDGAAATLCTDMEAGCGEGIERVPKQKVIKAYMAVRHSALLPDTEGQFPH